MQFIGYEITQDKEKCIQMEAEGKNHRPKMSPEDLNHVFNETFTQQELDEFENSYQDVLGRIEKSEKNAQSLLRPT